MIHHLIVYCLLVVIKPLITIPQYTSGVITNTVPMAAGTVSTPVVQTISTTFSITFTQVPQVFYSVYQLVQRDGYLCQSVVQTSLTTTQVTVKLQNCSPNSITTFSVAYLAINDLHLYVYSTTVSPTTSTTTTTISLTQYNWNTIPTYAIGIIGIQFQSAQLQYSNKIQITAISTYSATIKVTETNSNNIYYPIQYNIIFGPTQFIAPTTQSLAWNTGYLTVTVGSATYYAFALTKITSPSTYVQIQALSAIGFTLDGTDFALQINFIPGYISQATTRVSVQVATYSGFNYQPFICNGITSGNICSCPNGQYISYNGCLQCFGSCATCLTISTKCLTCTTNALLTGTDCICQNGYYMTTTFTCAQCDSSCLTCNIYATSCTSCPSSQVVVAGTCQNCAVKYQNLNGVCVSCQSNCDACYLTFCTQCSSSYLYQTTSCNSASLLQVGVCVSACQPGYFQNSASNCCQCATMCATCSAYSTCITCAQGYTQQGSNCQASCNLQYFNNNGTCAKCYQSCLTCTSAAYNACIQCLPSLLSYSGQCLAVCPSGTSVIQTTCIQCFSGIICQYLGCQSCTGTTQTQCLTCASGYYLLMTSCYQFCPLQYLQDSINYICLSCPNNCNTCQTTQICTTCSLNYYLYNNVCYPQCPLQTYASNQLCLPCDPSCQNCQNGLITGCTSCTGALLLSQGSCLTACQNGFYQNGNTCQQCDASCYYCNSSSNYCTACLNSFLNNSQCISSCPDGLYGDISQGLCQDCDPSCLTCFGPSQFNCLTCNNLLYNGTCIDSCPLGTTLSGGQCFDNNPIPLVCAVQCNGCYLSKYSCVACVGNRSNNPPLCSCQSGYFDSGQASCQQCDHQCKTCVTTSSTCIVCLGNRSTNNCTCPQGSFDDLVQTNCIDCLLSCSTCAASPNNCLSCRNNRILTAQATCNCLSGTYEANMSFCQNCNYQCQSCVTSSTNCLVCTDRRINAPTCSCPNGYYDNGQVVCVRCRQDCLTCNNSGCVTCPNNRVGPSATGTCDCPAGSTSLLPYSTYCQDCTVAVPYIYFDSLLKSIIVDFKVQIQTSIQQCAQVIDPITLTTLGISPQCSISNSLLAINLGFGATINVGDIVKFIPNSLIGSSTSSPCSTGYTQFNSEPVVLPSVPQSSLVPSVTFTNLNSVSSCQPISITFSQQYYDGMRNFKVSQIKQILPPNDQNQALQNFLISINQGTNLQTPIIIPANTLSHRTIYEFSMIITSFINIQNTQQLQFTTGSTEQVTLQFLTTQVVFYRYLQNNISVQVTYINCSNIRDQSTLLDAQWNINGSLYQTNQMQGLDSGFSAIVVLQIPSFNLSYGQTTLNLQIILNSNIVLVSQNLIFNIVKSPLSITLNGANEQYGLTQQINLSATIINHDYQVGDPIQEYIYTWKCQDIALQSACQDMFGNVIPFTQSSDQIIPAKTLTPYRAYLINLLIQYGSNTATTSGSLAITELDLPVLLYNSTSVFNLFDESIINLNYPNTNADALSYSAAIVYNLDVQTTFKFYYLSLKYKQWNFFSAINNKYTGNITLRATVYDPRYYMPSIAQIAFVYNIPPQNCQITLNTNLVIEFQTQLIIQVNYCTSANLPLYYRYSIYTNNDTYNSDILASQDLNRILLQDYIQDTRSLTTLLYFNQTDNSSTQVQIIMISIKDSLNGITNITMPITVQINSLLSQQIFQGYINQKSNLDDIIYAYQLVGNRLITFPGLSSYKSEVYSTLLQYLTQQLTPSLECVLQSVTWQLSEVEGVSSVLNISQAIKINAQITTMMNSCISKLKLLYSLQLNGALDSYSFLFYYQTYQSVNYLIALLSSQINYFTQQNQSTTELIVLLDSTIYYIQNLSVPNQPPSITYSKHLNLYASLQSEKIINQITGNLLQQQPKLGSNATRLLQITSQAQIYKYSNKIYNNNPFYSDASFPKNSSNYSCVDISLINQQTQASQAIIQNASIAIQLKQPTNNTLSCISKLSGSWQANICKTTKVNSTVSCNCQQLSPVSLMLAFNQIEEQTAKSFTSDAINALASFHFWETIVFYVYLLTTFVYVGVLYKGYLLDKNHTQVFPKIDQEIDQHEQQEPPPKEMQFKQYRIIRIDDQVQGSSPSDRQDSNNIQTAKAQTSKDSIITSKVGNSQEEKIKLSRLEGYIIFVKQFHILFSIFYKFDKSLSRPVRCTIYYISTLGMLSTTFMFGKSSNISLNIAIALILAPMTKIFTLVFEKLISHQTMALKYVGVVLMASVSGFWSYMLLTQIALLGDVYEVNYQTINFILTWIFDISLYGPIQLIFQFVVQTYIVNLPFMRQFLEKLLDEQSRQFIQELSQQL